MTISPSVWVRIEGWGEATAMRCKDENFGKDEGFGQEEGVCQEEDLDT